MFYIVVGLPDDLTHEVPLWKSMSD